MNLVSKYVVLVIFLSLGDGTQLSAAAAALKVAVSPDGDCTTQVRAASNGIFTYFNEQLLKELADEAAVSVLSYRGEGSDFRAHLLRPDMVPLFLDQHIPVHCARNADFLRALRNDLLVTVATFKITCPDVVRAPFIRRHFFNHAHQLASLIQSRLIALEGGLSPVACRHHGAAAGHSAPDESPIASIAYYPFTVYQAVAFGARIMYARDCGFFALFNALCMINEQLGFPDKELVPGNMKKFDELYREWYDVVLESKGIIIEMAARKDFGRSGSLEHNPAAQLKGLSTVDRIVLYRAVVSGKCSVVHDAVRAALGKHGIVTEPWRAGVSMAESYSAFKTRGKKDPVMAPMVQAVEDFRNGKIAWLVNLMVMMSDDDLDHAHAVVYKRTAAGALDVEMAESDAGPYDVKGIKQFAQEVLMNKGLPHPAADDAVHEAIKKIEAYPVPPALTKLADVRSPLWIALEGVVLPMVLAEITVIERCDAVKSAAGVLKKYFTQLSLQAQEHFKGAVSDRDSKARCAWLNQSVYPVLSVCYGLSESVKQLTHFKRQLAEASGGALAATAGAARIAEYECQLAEKAALIPAMIAGKAAASGGGAGGAVAAR